MSFVVDASVAVEFLLRTDVGRRLVPTLGSDVLVAPELMDTEVAAVLRRELLRGRLDEDRAAEALEDLIDWDVQRLPHRWLLPRAWAFRHNASAYDAMYLAAASIHGATVLTADGPLARIPIEGVVVHNVRQWSPA